MFNTRNFISKLASNVRRFLKLFVTHLDRESIARIYIKGKGIEIGALHSPLRVSKSAQVTYLDRMSIPDLRKQYRELHSKNLVPINIIDDGEKLSKVPDSTQDFVIANHFLEHCQNPIGTIENILRVLRRGGILYLSIPDKRFSFDKGRPVTAIEHLLRDYNKGPDWSKRQHFEEWTKYVGMITDVAEVEQQVLSLMRSDYSIHYHAWTQTEIIELILIMKKRLNFEFELELLATHDEEVIAILKKSA
jgi:predicted SAM-dependent methyltransferase